MHSKFIILDGVVAAVLAINVLANTHPGDAAFGLRDALVESGQSELAEHFQEAYHPRGCWGLDMILGRK